MSCRTRIEVETWYRVEKGWTSNENDIELDTSNLLGIVATPEEALALCKKHGLSAMSWEQFKRTNQAAFGLVKPVLVAFTDLSRAKGRIVSEETIELSYTLEARRQKIADAAREAGIPLEVIDLSRVT